MSNSIFTLWYISTAKSCSLWTIRYFLSLLHFLYTKLWISLRWKSEDRYTSNNTIPSHCPLLITRIRDRGLSSKLKQQPKTLWRRYIRSIGDGQHTPGPYLTAWCSISTVFVQLVLNAAVMNWGPLHHVTGGPFTVWPGGPFAVWPGGPFTVWPGGPTGWSGRRSLYEVHHEELWALTRVARPSGGGSTQIFYLSLK